MRSVQFLNVFWGLLALGGTFFIYLVVRAVQYLRKHPKPIEKPKPDLLVETLKEQADRVREVVQERDDSKMAFQNLDQTYRAVTYHIPIGLMVFQMDGPIALVNPAFSRILPNRSTVPTNYSELPSELQDQIQIFLAPDPPLEKRIEIQWNNNPIIADISMVDLGNNWYLMLIQDKTKVIHLQKNLKMKKDLALMGEVASGITHEIKNSLSIISGNLQLLTRQQTVQEALQGESVAGKTFGALEREITRLLDVTRKFMRSSKAPNLNLSEFWIGDLIEELKLHWKQDILSNRLQVKPTLPFRVSGDFDQLKSAINNLILNGLEAVENQGFVSLSTYLSQDNSLVIDIQDTGQGLAPEMQKKLFTPLVTTKAHGSGLGLYQARKIIHAHNGEIHYSNPPTCFTISLPLSDGSSKSHVVDDTLC